MKYVLVGIVAVYALLSVVASVHQLRTEKRKDTSVMMLCGALILIAAAVLQLLNQQFDWIVSIVGGALICAAAYMNGKRGESFHASHHIVRFVITVLFVIGFALL